jgi:hypothetical protein
MKKLSFFLMAMLFSMVSFAASVEFVAGTDKTADGTNAVANCSLTKDGVTIQLSNGCLGRDDNYRIYQNQWITVTSTVGNITSIEFTCTASNDTKYGPGCFEYRDQNGAYAYADKIGTWTGNAAEVILYASKAQVRATKIVVTVGEGGETPDPTPDPEEPEEPVVPEVPENLGAKTIAEFLELKNTTDTCVLTGVVANIANTTYGNFDLVDATGSVYVYGLLTAAGESKQFASMDIAAGDTLTVKAIYNEYNGNPQVKNAIYVSHTKNATPEPEPDPTPDPEEPETPGEGSDNVTYVFADDTSNPGNGGDWLTGTIDAYSTWTATKGGNNNPKYYDSGTGLRVYNGGTFTITSTKLIETITLTFSTSSYTFSADNTETPQTVTVNANSYEWSVGRTCRLQKIEITYGNSDVTIVKTLKSIALSGMTTIYETGDVFNFNGTCIATYAVTKDDIAQDEEQKEVTPTSVSEPDMTTAGEKEVIVTYTEDDVTVTATYTITVNLAEGDKLVLETTGVEGTGYADWSNVEGASGAVYAGNSAGGNNSIQLRKSASDKPAAGIITTTSGGLISKVKVSWNINTADGRTLNVYGKNTAYTAVSELYDAATAGELLGTIVEGTSTELVIDGDFEYVGIVSASGALYLDKVVFVWEENETPDGPGTALDNITIDTNITKTIENGQLIIIKNGVKYNVAGAVVK